MAIYLMSKCAKLFADIQSGSLIKVSGLAIELSETSNFVYDFE